MQTYGGTRDENHGLKQSWWLRYRSDGKWAEKSGWGSDGGRTKITLWDDSHSSYLFIRVSNQGKEALKKYRPISWWLTKEMFPLCLNNHLHSIPWVLRQELLQTSDLTHPQKKCEPPGLASHWIHIIIVQLWSACSDLGSLPDALCVSPHLFLSVTLKATASFILILQMRKLRLGEITQLVSAEVRFKSRTAYLPNHGSLQSDVSLAESLCTIIWIVHYCCLVSLFLRFPSALHFLSLYSCLRPISHLCSLSTFMEQAEYAKLLLSDCFSPCFYFSVMPAGALAEST